MLAAHALLIGICFGLVFMLGMLIFGPRLLELLGGRGNVLAQAIGYTQIFFGGAVIPWLMNTMAGILRGTGNMKLPSSLMLSSAICQIILGGTLGLGLGPIPSFGMRGVAAGSLIAYVISIAVMSWYLFSGRARVVPKLKGPAHSVGDVHRHPQGRRDRLLLAAAIGADHQHLHPHAGEFRHRNPRRLRHRRAARIHADVDGVRGRHRLGADGRHGDRRRTAWRGRAASPGSPASSPLRRSALVANIIAIFPDLWVSIFTDDAAVRATSRQYLSTAAPMYAFLGLATAMYFSSQGAAKVLGPVLAQTARLVFIIAGGWWLSSHDATAQDFFVLTAASMGLLGVLSCISVILTQWGPKHRAVPRVRPALS